MGGGVSLYASGNGSVESTVSEADRVLLQPCGIFHLPKSEHCILFESVLWLRWCPCVL